ncbi:MAG: dihydroorotate dehydrogenase [Lachnospiraceae bacterium]|nr:dihydroorotate dehydrogenase [Lachnospiraceae bacterium]
MKYKLNESILLEADDTLLDIGPNDTLTGGDTTTNTGNISDFGQAFEINVSCPNVKSGGIAFGTVPSELEKVTKEVKKHSKKPVIMKLSPNVTSISEMAKAAEAAGADAISLINTFTAMKIDIYKRKFAIANRTGGLSGPAIRPIAVRMVYEAAHSVKIPVIGMGGIASGEDAIEFLMAGAKAVAVGMYNFHNPNAMTDVIAGIEKYMEKTGTEDINEIIALDL